MELEGVEPSAGISVRRDRHAALAPRKERKANVPLGSSGCWPFIFIYYRICINFDSISQAIFYFDMYLFCGMFVKRFGEVALESIGLYVSG